MQYFINMPALKLSDDELIDMRNTYYQFEKDYNRTYVSESGEVTPLTIVAHYPKTETILSIENKINDDLIDASYFVSNFGINPHIDDNRQCIISFEIQNIENIPINFHLAEDKIEKVYYNNEPLMWNPQIEHSADDSKTLRIFFQIELKRDRTFFRIFRYALEKSNIEMTIKLNVGLYYKAVMIKGQENFDDIFLAHLENARNNGDALAENYNTKHIRRMWEYGYVYNEDPSDLVYMVGLENFQNKAFRIESRLYVHPKYRRRLWRSPDNYETVKLQINNNIADCDFLFKSREAANTAGFTISAKLDPYFRDWTIYPEKIELRYQNNWQYIMYKPVAGNEFDHIQKLWYQKGPS